MRRWSMIGLGVLLVVAVILVAAAPVRSGIEQLAADLKLIIADTGDVMAGATYQRYRARREAVAAMQADLRWLARAESAFIADSGHPTVYLPPAYGHPTGRGNMLTDISIERNGWRATISNIHTTMTCTLFAELDTASGRYVPGEPRCFSPRPAETVELAAAPPAPTPPRAVTPEPPPPTTPPRSSRDWGPVNNTPPPAPWIAKNVCPGEYCNFGRWAACSAITAYQDKRRDAPPALIISAGETFTAVTGDMHVEAPGMVVFRDTATTPRIEGGPDIDSILFTPADTLYLLMYEGEGYMTWWFRGRAVPGYEFWRDHPREPLPQRSDGLTLVRRPESVWWVRVRDAENREGWIAYDFYKMATGSTMDVLARCLR